MKIEDQLEQYADLLEREELLHKQMDELIAGVPVPKEITDQWEAIKAEFWPMIEVNHEAVEDLKVAIEDAVLKAEATAKSSRYMAVWNKGRASWNGKALEGFAMAHPEILQARTFGNPTVTFRKVK